MNSLISSNTGFETDVIKTGNAGEHAMSLNLAEVIPYASGFAIEPQELVSIFEHYGGVHAVSAGEKASSGIEIFQIETRNPHLHEEKGEEHLNEMVLDGLGSIYHSPLCGEETERLILDQLRRRNILSDDQTPPAPKLISPPSTANFEKFREIVENHLESYSLP